jgi:hypothetical protein
VQDVKRTIFHAAPTVSSVESESKVGLLLVREVVEDASLDHAVVAEAKRNARPRSEVVIDRRRLNVVTLPRERRTKKAEKPAE